MFILGTLFLHYMYKTLYRSGQLQRRKCLRQLIATWKKNWTKIPQKLGQLELPCMFFLFYHTGKIETNWISHLEDWQNGANKNRDKKIFLAQNQKWPNEKKMTGILSYQLPQHRIPHPLSYFRESGEELIINILRNIFSAKKRNVKFLRLKNFKSLPYNFRF
jgi:hypothetical protein